MDKIIETKMSATQVTKNKDSSLKEKDAQKKLLNKNVTFSK